MFIFKRSSLEIVGSSVSEGEQVCGDCFQVFFFDASAAPAKNTRPPPKLAVADRSPMGSPARISWMPKYAGTPFSSLRKDRSRWSRSALFTHANENVFERAGRGKANQVRAFSWCASRSSLISGPNHSETWKEEGTIEGNSSRKGGNCHRYPKGR